MMSKWPYQTPGIPDEKFIRGEVPMTKAELRAVVIAKLCLKKDSLVYDIGAGTGSVTVETALQAVEGQVFAVEKEKAAVDLLKQNLAEFQLANVRLVKGEAPQVLAELPLAERIFIGGSGGRLKDILAVADSKLKLEGRIVLTAITLNTLCTANHVLKELNYQVEICQVAVTKTKDIANVKMFQGNNPVYIISAEKRE